jgi:hypothetical protein
MDYVWKIWKSSKLFSLGHALVADVCAGQIGENKKFGTYYRYA